MQEFDPRRSSVRLAPRLLVSVLAVGVAAVGWQVSGLGHLGQSASTITAATIQARAPAPQSAFADPVDIAVKVKSGETLEAAVRRTGVTPTDARQAVGTLAKAFDTVHIKAGLAFDAAVAQPPDRRGSLRLVALSLHPGPARALTLSRTLDGVLRLSELDQPVHDEVTVAQGAVGGSLFQSAQAAGAPPALTTQAVRLFANKLDFTRDIHTGDRFRLIYRRKVTADGHLVSLGDLVYAEITAKGQSTRFYRYQAPGAAQPDFFDADGKSTHALLLRTPVLGARITSGFGLRLHPILGYTRMHQGIDFGVPVGTPVLAAGDGVVEQARWAGGYGRYVKLRHADGWETAYGHLSRWAARPGQHVRQGQVIAYSGSSGESTGPHVHFEVIDHGVRINPKSARAPVGATLAGADLAAFETQRAHVDLVLAQAASPGARLAAASLIVPIGAHPPVGGTLTR